MTDKKEQKKQGVDKLPCGHAIPRLKKVFMSAEILSDPIIEGFNKKKAAADSRVLEMTLVDEKTMILAEKKLNFEKQLADVMNRMSLQPEIFDKHKQIRKELDDRHSKEVKALTKKFTDIKSRTEAKRNLILEHDKEIAEWGDEFKRLDDVTQQLIEDSIALRGLISKHTEGIELRVKRDDEYMDLVEKAHDHYIEFFDEFFVLVYEEVDQDQLFSYGIDDMMFLVYNFFVKCSESSESTEK